MINEITRISRELKQIGVDEFSIKCSEAYLDVLKVQIVNKFSLFSLEVPDMKKGIDMYIFGVRFKAQKIKSSSKK